MLNTQEMKKLDFGLPKKLAQERVVVLQIETISRRFAGEHGKNIVFAAPLEQSRSPERIAEMMKRILVMKTKSDKKMWTIPLPTIRGIPPEELVIGELVPDGLPLNLPFFVIDPNSLDFLGTIILGNTGLSLDDWQTNGCTPQREMFEGIKADEKVQFWLNIRFGLSLFSNSRDRKTTAEDDELVKMFAKRCTGACILQLARINDMGCLTPSIIPLPKSWSLQRG